jgi:acyl-coenzyme A thioesterase PaaI-like protein
MPSLVSVTDVNEFLERDFPGSGNRCAEVGDGFAVAVLDSSAANLRPGGIISGPTVFGVCDAALYYACFTVLGIEPMALTSELSIRFLRPAQGAVLYARADLDQVGRRSIIGTVRAWTGDPAKPVAVAQGTYVRPIVAT